jgi:hypothetical protein
MMPTLRSERAREILSMSIVRPFVFGRRPSPGSRLCNQAASALNTPFAPLLRTLPLALILADAPLVKAQTGNLGECYRTMIVEPTPYLANGGETIIMADGTIWKDTSYFYLYLYEYNPSVILCPSSGRMLLRGREFSLVPIGRLQRTR